MLLLRNRKVGWFRYGRRFGDYVEGREWRKKKGGHSASLPSEDRPWIIPLIKSCSSEMQLRQLHARILLAAAGRDAAISAAFLSAAAALPNSVEYLVLFFERISKPFTPHYNAMIRGLAKSASPERAFFLFREMRRRRIRADPVSFSFALKACGQMHRHSAGRQLHGEIIRHGHQPDSLLLTSLMDVYASCGSTLEAEHLFDEMPQRDLVAWNVLISCYTRNGRSADAIVLFDLMQDKPYGIQPDQVTCLLLLQACANLGALNSGDRVRRYAESRGYGGAANLQNSLITMYSKCGAIDKALSIFREIPAKNTISWSAIISGLAMNSRGREALEAFSEMRAAGIPPDEQTLTGVLSACSRGGMIEEGLAIFRSISSPNLHHYGCAVELMARAGNVDQAYRLILDSPELNPDARIWRTLLGACRIHRRRGLGELARRHLAELRAREAGDFILLLNICAENGDREKAAEVRRTMEERNIQTRPGCSTIEIGGRVHEFAAEDRGHEREAEIYEMVGEMMRQVRMGGYVARAEAELHRGGEEAAAAAGLSFHSEKLAIALGMMSTPPCEAIRVAKDLRTCEDCHEFAKAVSAVYNREIVVWDRSRFHRFRHGRCSCNDYW